MIKLNLSLPFQINIQSLTLSYICYKTSNYATSYIKLSEKQNTNQSHQTTSYTSPTSSLPKKSSHKI